MKRLKPSIIPSPPTTPPSPHHLQSTPKHLNPTPNNRRRSIFQTPQIDAGAGTISWTPLNITNSELSLPLTFPTGQTFRWKKTGPSQYTGPIGPHLVSLKQFHDNSVAYHFHSTIDEDVAKADLFDFLNMGISLKEMWGEFRVRDKRFGELSVYLEGARVLRQDPLECLIQFICSSNNNIGRITKMVEFVEGKGRFLGRVGGCEFFEFPSLEKLGMVKEGELREAGFGYRLSIFWFMSFSCWLKVISML